jgi:hypothetical protein
MLPVPNADVFGHLVTIRNQELSSLWIRFNLFLLIDGGLLVAVGSAADGSIIDQLAGAPAIFGIVFTILWSFSENAGRDALRFWDAKIGTYEIDWDRTDLTAFKVFRDMPGYVSTTQDAFPASVPAPNHDSPSRLLERTAGYIRNLPTRVSRYIRMERSARVDLQDQSRVSWAVIGVFFAAWIIVGLRAA